VDSLKWPVVTAVPNCKGFYEAYSYADVCVCLMFIGPCIFVISEE